jgi:hypothetical protein
MLDAESTISWSGSVGMNIEQGVRCSYRFLKREIVSLRKPWKRGVRLFEELVFNIFIAGLGLACQRGPEFDPRPAILAVVLLAVPGVEVLFVLTVQRWLR